MEPSVFVNISRLKFMVSTERLRYRGRGYEAETVHDLDAYLCRIPRPILIKLDYSRKCVLLMATSYLRLNMFDEAIQKLRENVQNCADEHATAEEMETRLYLALALYKKGMHCPNVKHSKDRLALVKEAEVTAPRYQKYYNKQESPRPSLVGHDFMSNLLEMRLIVLCTLLDERINAAKIQASKYLEAVVDAGLTQNPHHCHYCNQVDGDNVELLKCPGCKVKYYCSEKHQKMCYTNCSFLDHKLVCPFLNRYRRLKLNMQKGKRSKENFDAVQNDLVKAVQNRFVKLRIVER